MLLRGLKLFVCLGQIFLVALAAKKKKVIFISVLSNQMPYFRHMETFWFDAFKQNLAFCFCLKKIFLPIKLILKGKRIK